MAVNSGKIQTSPTRGSAHGSSGSTPGQKLLEMKVDADEGLVEGDDAYTWIQLSAEKPGCLAWCMKDDDGELS